MEPKAKCLEGGDRTPETTIWRKDTGANRDKDPMSRSRRNCPSVRILRPTSWLASYCERLWCHPSKHRIEDCRGAALLYVRVGRVCNGRSFELRKRSHCVPVRFSCAHDVLHWIAVCGQRIRNQ